MRPGGLRGARRLWNYAVALAPFGVMLLGLSGCTKRQPNPPQATFTKPAGLHGRLYFCVWQAIEGEGVSKYDVDLDHGTTTLIEHTFRSVSEIRIPPEVTNSYSKLSPDGRYVASQLEPAPDGTRALRVLERATHLQPGYLHIPPGAEITSLTWSTIRRHLLH